MFQRGVACESVWISIRGRWSFWMSNETVFGSVVKFEDDKDGTMASASFRHAGEGRGIGGIEHDRLSGVGPSLRMANDRLRYCFVLTFLSTQSAAKVTGGMCGTESSVLCIVPLHGGTLSVARTSSIFLE